MCLEVGQIWLPALGASQGGSLAEGPSRDGEWSLSVHRAPAGVSDLTPAGGVPCGALHLSVGVSKHGPAGAAGLQGEVVLRPQDLSGKLARGDLGFVVGVWSGHAVVQWCG